MTKSDLDTTLHKLNSLHDNLKLTSECEKDGNFHFLDVNIKFMDGQFYTSTCVKPTNTGTVLGPLLQVLHSADVFLT